MSADWLLAHCWWLLLWAALSWLMLEGLAVGGMVLPAAAEPCEVR